MAKGKLRIATCQFAVSNSIDRNAGWITRLMQQAQQGRAEIVHFSECALSGYAGVDFASFQGYDWPLLQKRTKEILALAKKLGLWVILGSSYRLTEPNRPHNSLYVIDCKGRIVNRYDKRFGTPADLEHYTPGDRFVTFRINGVRCGVLICFDLRFPELYRELKKLRIDCIFQSFYNARQKHHSIHTEIMRQTMQTRAATNGFWVSMNNSSAYYSAYPSTFIQPDGHISNHLRFHRPGIMFNTVDLNREFYDPSAPFRNPAMSGILTNRCGKVDDPRSTRRNII
ncbi:MAG: carbon-nitrogen hydrolase family protein [Planctomycetota bacterium]